MSYNPRKAAQTIAFFAVKNNGRAINTLKAVKLVYLADRASIEKFGFPIQDERRVSMPNGPVNSITYNYIKGEVLPQHDGGWSSFLKDRANHNIGLVNSDISVDDLDELSEADIEVLEEVWLQFGSMSQWDLVEWTHDPQKIPEWKDPGGSSRPIHLKDIMVALGVENPQQSASEVSEAARASEYLRSL